MKKLFLLFVISLSFVITGCGNTEEVKEEVLEHDEFGEVIGDKSQLTTHMEAKVFDGLNYRLYVPHDYNEKKEYQLLLFLHGSGERGSDNTAQIAGNNEVITNIMYDKRYTHKFIIVAPQCPSDDFWVGWKDGKFKDNESMMDSTALTKTINLVKDLNTTYNIKGNSIVGLSMGGMGTFHLITEHQDVFDIAAPICGLGSSLNSQKLVDVPLWIFHGSEDTTVLPDSSRAVAYALESLGSKTFKYTEYKGVNHGSWINAFAEEKLIDFLYTGSFE